MTEPTARKKIIFIPGKNPKPDPEIHRALLWRALLTGVTRVDAETVQALSASGDLVLIAWNFLYYQETKLTETDAPYIETLLRKDGPDAHDIEEALSCQNRRARLLYMLGDLFPVLIPFIPDPAVKSTIAETLCYFENRDGIGSRIRELLKAPLRRMFADGERVLIIGHSMGSIIAYDALWELWHEENNHGRVDLLITLGSPLGMRFVQKRLLGFREKNARRFPGNIRRWKNIAAQGDLTALDPTLRDDFRTMIRLGLTDTIEDVHEGVFGYFRDQDGLNVHRSYGYLVQPAVGATIADWWNGRQAPAQIIRPRGDEDEPLPVYRT